MTLTAEEVQKVRRSQETAEVVEILLNEKTPQEVTSHFGEGRGWPDEEYYEVTSTKQEGNSISADCTVSFKEVEMSGCPDMPRKHSRSGEFSLTIGLDGEVSYQFHV